MTTRLDADNLSDASDAELLRRMRANDGVAWQALYHRYLPLAWRLAYQLVGDRQLAEDIVSESLLALCRRAKELDPDKTLLFGWLRGVIRHKAMDHHRYKARTAVAMNGHSQLQTAKASAAAPGLAMEQKEQAAEVQKVLEVMEPSRRLCLEWKYVEKLPVRKIASRLDVTEKAAESLLYRARLEFRERFERLQSGDPYPCVSNVASTIAANKTEPVEPSDRSPIQ